MENGEKYIYIYRRNRLPNPYLRICSYINCCVLLFFVVIDADGLESRECVFLCVIG